MRKIFLTAIALLSIACAQVFGMYAPSSGGWIGFLTDGNHLRVRMNQFGFTLGNGTIKGTFGFVNGRDAWLSTANGLYYDFAPTISMGLGYTSSPISVGVGYSATIGDRYDKYNGKDTPKKTEAVAHTPVLVLNALDNAFRMAIPIQVVHLTDKGSDGDKSSITAVSVDAQFRYYTGLDVFPHVRLILRYGSFGYEHTEDGTKVKGKLAESFGFTFRFDFLKTVIEEVTLAPFVQIAYNTALGKQHSKPNVTAVGVLTDTATFGNGKERTSLYTASYGVGAWNFSLMPALGLSASSDVVSLYVEPSLGLSITQSGHETEKVKEKYGLAYNAYAEVYINPVKNLSWYFILGVGNKDTTYVSFDGATGFNWYLPTFN